MAVGEKTTTGEVVQVIGPVVLRRVPPRKKRIAYDGALLPKIDKSKEYAASDIVTAAMKVFAKDGHEKGMHLTESIPTPGL